MISLSDVDANNSILENNSGNFPTFHILIATCGRNSLKRMLDSLKNELNERDAISIIFDGADALNKSSFNNNWISTHKCKINIIEQVPNLGFWGHGIRNIYQGILDPRTTFIMNADDDDEYIPGSFNKLRSICIDPNILYISKFLVKHNNILIPRQNEKIVQNDIGTPCGIIPFDIANTSSWAPRYGGDFNYYDNLQYDKIQFLDIVIYNVL